LGSQIPGVGQESYIGGARWPFPLPLLFGTVAAGVVAVPIGLVALRRLRGDYEAMVMLVLSLIAVGVANAELGLVNGPAGIYSIPKPLSTSLLQNLSPLAYQWVFALCAVFLSLVVFGVSWAISTSPFGRNLRAVRENEAVVIASGRNAVTLRLQVFVIGAMIGGLSGGVAVEFIGAWAPGGWEYVETFVLITAIIVGGKGNLAGVALGTALVPVLLLEVTRFLPNIGYAGLIDSLEWVVIGAITLVFLWFRPRGILPERRRRYGRTGWVRAGGRLTRREG
jgi:branched-chain amino acid transport system permease protein